VAVEPFHLFRYLDEQMFRFNNRATKDNPLNDSDRFDLAIRQIVGKRLTYASLTGKVGRWWRVSSRGFSAGAMSSTVLKNSPGRMPSDPHVSPG
jgi:hypothetical protein